MCTSPLSCILLHHSASVNQLRPPPQPNPCRSHKPAPPPPPPLPPHAALFQPGAFATSPDGLEVTLAVDYYAHVVLTLGLLDELKAAAPSRVVLQSSQAEQFGAVDLANLKVGDLGKAAEGHWGKEGPGRPQGKVKGGKGHCGEGRPWQASRRGVERRGTVG